MKTAGTIHASPEGREPECGKRGTAASKPQLVPDMTEATKLHRDGPRALLITPCPELPCATAPFHLLPFPREPVYTPAAWRTDNGCCGFMAGYRGPISLLRASARGALVLSLGSSGFAPLPGEFRMNRRVRKTEATFPKLFPSY